MQVAIDLPKKFSVLFKPSRYKVAYGGRGGAKSWSMATALIIMAMQRKIRVLCCREIQKSISESVYYVLKAQIERMGLQRVFDVTNTTIRCVNGSEFIFAGLRTNIASIKSLEAINIAWVEEAQSVSKASLDILDPTIRTEGSEIWFSFNPHMETDPVYESFVKRKDEDAILIPVGWQDNPWFPEVLRRRKDVAYEIDPESAAHIWGGQCTSHSKATILRDRWVVESREPTNDWGGPYYGGDWGYAGTPTVFVRCWIETISIEPPIMNLYIDHCAEGLEVDIVDTPQLLGQVPGSKNHTLRSDPARPESINHMRQHGYPMMVPADKGPGSVEDGVTFLRGFKQVFIHPRCTLAIEQAKLYRFETDKLTGEVLPKIKKGNDDVWDAVRYALELVIKKFVKDRPHSEDEKAERNRAAKLRRNRRPARKWTTY